jgi:hypothetical protein
MERTFEDMGRRLPDDMPGFIADGMRQAAVQDVPDEVSAVLRRYREKWPGHAPH